MFLVDASSSLNKTDYENVLTYIKVIFCAFDPRVQNRAGMIVFNANIELRIALSNYTAEEWFDAVETERAADLCCSCCTPLVEALELAYTTFQGTPPSQDTLPMTFILTDGQVSLSFQRDIREDANHAFCSLSKMESLHLLHIPGRPNLMRNMLL